MLYMKIGILEKFTIPAQQWILGVTHALSWLSMGHCRDDPSTQAHHLTAWLNTALLVATGFNSVPRTASG